ncbi:MAG: septum formation initiator family protein [Chloroflexi bacterium]|nr:septum formation initiator family protein [Chloroflexota bacterium]MCL5074247.1 septum formation initiator family protein [Chloroflexota bacterium]
MSPDRTKGYRLRFPVRRFLFAAVLAIVVYLLLSFGGLVMSGYKLNQQAEQLRREIALLKAENEALQKRLSALQTDEELERLAREDLNWVKPGEVLVLPIKQQEGLSSAPQSSNEASGKDGYPPNWRRWWALFWDR